MRSGRHVPYLLIAPSLIFLTVLFLVPLGQTIALAFQADGGWSTANFSRMANDLNFSDAAANTFKIVVIVVPLQLCLALGMAMMLRHVQRGRDIVLWIWSIPLGISDLAAGLVWLAILTDRGYLNSVLNGLGLIKGPESWLSYETPVALLAAIVVAEAWRATAIVLVILVAGVQLVPKEYGEAADVFGATPWQRFHAHHAAAAEASIHPEQILRTVLAFEMFAIVLSLGGRNFPVLVSEAFNWQYNNQDFGVAAAYAVVVMAVSLAATMVYIRVLRTPPEQR
jgi:multiple sugar transport system permease protein